MIRKGKKMKKGIFAKNSFKRLLAYLIAFVFICAINQKMEVRADSSTTISFGETYEGTTANGGINKY